MVGALGGSLTIIAESIRGALMNACEGLALVVMRRVHRGKLAGLDYGSGKLEQAANLVIGGGLAAGSVWILIGAMALLTGAAPLGTPLGLALAAIVGGINCYINFLAWDGVRRAARGSIELIMEGQLRARSVKLVSSLLVQTTMTVAALSTDHLVVAIADAAGSLLVCVVMGNSAVRMIAAAVPDLIDRAAAPGVRNTVERAVAEQLGALAPLPGSARAAPAGPCSSSSRCPALRRCRCPSSSAASPRCATACGRSCRRPTSPSWSASRPPDAARRRSDCVAVANGSALAEQHADNALEGRPTGYYPAPASASEKPKGPP